MVSDGSRCALCSADLAPVVAIFESWLVVLNRNQNLLGKSMLVLRRHAESVTDLTGPEWMELQVLIGRTTAALRRAFDPDHFNYVFLQNQDRHVHLHVVPRYASERTVLGSVFVDSSWPDHYAVSELRVSSSDELAAITDAVSAAW